MNQIEFYQAKLEYEIDSADTAISDLSQVVIIDTRSIEWYEKEHIENAVSFPHKTMNEESVKGLDKDKTYICYCDGIGCNASTKGALKLASFGFKTKELMGGLDWWKRDGYNTKGNEARQNTPSSCGC